MSQQELIKKRKHSADNYSVFDWVFVALCFNGILYNEAIGSVPLYFSLIILILVVAAYPAKVLRLFESQKVILLLLPAYCLLSALWSSVPSETVRGALQAALVVTFAVVMCRTIPAREFVHIVFLSMTIVIILSFIVNNRVLDGMTNEVNWSGIYRNKNSMSMIGVFFGLCCAHHAMDNYKHSLMRLVYLCLLPLSFIVCYSAKSVAMMVILCIGLGLMAVFYPATRLPRRLVRPAIEQLSIAILTVCALGLFVVANFSNDLLRLVGKSPTLTGRTVLWDWAGKLIPSHFWLGHGYGGFWVQGNPMAEMLWRSNHIASRSGFHFHNLFYEVWIEIGILGVAIALVFLIWTFVTCYRWLYNSGNITSVFYTSCVVVMLVSQYQDVQLFGGFSTMYIFFVIAGAYAHDFLMSYKYSISVKSTAEAVFDVAPSRAASGQIGSRTS